METRRTGRAPTAADFCRNRFVTEGNANQARDGCGLRTLYQLVLFTVSARLGHVMDLSSCTTESVNSRDVLLRMSVLLSN